MADLIKNDIEKIERALNIRLDDPGIELTWNTAFPDEENEQKVFDDYPSVSNHSSLLTLATALNLCCQRHLFQLSQHCQASIESSRQSKASEEEILPIQIFELYTDSLRSESADDSISSLRRWMQREEKARLTSNEMIEKLISAVVRYLRQIQSDQWPRTSEPFPQRSDREVIEDQTNPIDWSSIVSMLETKDFERCSEKSLEHLWREVCLPSISSTKNWSEEEDRLLSHLIDIHGPFADQWSLIASHFPHRSAYTCVNRYMSSENRRRDQMKFNVDRLKELKELVEECRCEHYVPLNKIAYRLDCSLASIRREWRNVDPEVRRGQWNIDEDQTLLRSVLKQSTRERIDWHLVARDVPGRSSTKCYHRYIHLTRKTGKSEFQQSDDHLLLEQHRIKQGRWSEIQLSFPERSCYTLQNRWRKLTQFRQIDELFASQSSSVQSFLLRQFSDPSHPRLQLTLDQLRCLISQQFFLQFCEQTSSSSSLDTVPRLGIRRLLNQMPGWNTLEQVKETFLATKSRRRK